MVESHNLKRSNHVQCFGIFKKLTFFTRRIDCALFHDAKFGHTFKGAYEGGEPPYACIALHCTHPN